MKKYIEVLDCVLCPIINECKEFKKLTSKQKFIIKTGVGLNNAILKTCPLPNLKDSVRGTDVR